MTRQTYTIGHVRADDLVEGDVCLLPDAQPPSWQAIVEDRQPILSWRWIMDVWNDNDREHAERIYAGPGFEHVRKLIAQHLTGHGYYVLVRYVAEHPAEVDSGMDVEQARRQAEEAANAEDSEIATALVPVRGCDLVTTQVPSDTAACRGCAQPVPTAFGPAPTGTGRFL